MSTLAYEKHLWRRPFSMRGVSHLWHTKDYLYIATARSVSHWVPATVASRNRPVRPVVVVTASLSKEWVCTIFGMIGFGEPAASLVGSCSILKGMFAQASTEKGTVVLIDAYGAN